MSQFEKCDRRSLRSQRALRQALASELAESGDLSRINVASLTERAGLTRRTFYSHYRDIPDFISQIEDGLLAEIRERVELITAAQLPDLYRNIDELEPAPGSVELLRYLAANRDLIGALLGPGGDPAFIKKIIDTAREAVVPRAQTGILGLALGTFFDYYVTYVVSAEVGMIQRWFERGLTESPEVGMIQRWFERDLSESPETMARIMTVIAFVRPGDLYGQPIDINVPEYGMKLLNLQLEDAADTVATVESND